jgi:hypothetical protein
MPRPISPVGRIESLQLTEKPFFSFLYSTRALAEPALEGRARTARAWSPKVGMKGILLLITAS